MASAMHKMAVYLGLVEDDQRYDDGYDAYEEYDRVRRGGGGCSRGAGAIPAAAVSLGTARAASGRDRADHRSRTDHHPAPAHVQ